MKNSKKASSNAAKARGKKASLKALKPKRATSKELRQVVGGQGGPKRPPV